MITGNAGIDQRGEGLCVYAYCAYPEVDGAGLEAEAQQRVDALVLDVGQRLLVVVCWFGLVGVWVLLLWMLPLVVWLLGEGGRGVGDLEPMVCTHTSGHTHSIHAYICIHI